MYPCRTTSAITDGTPGYLTTMLFGVEPTDPITFGVLSVAVAAVSVVACYVPARRAARVDPICAIRVE